MASTRTSIFLFFTFAFILCLSNFNVKILISKPEESVLTSHYEIQHFFSKKGVVDSVKPYFILHIGPTKTGSTTLQCGLVKYSNDLAFLDGYYYIGKFPADCRHQYENTRMPNNETPLKGKETIQDLSSLMKKLPRLFYRNKSNFQKSLQKHWLQGHNVVFSAEEFELNPSVLSELSYLQKQWNVKVVITYRRYFEWLVSSYNQNMKIGINRWPSKNRRPTGLVNYLSKYSSYLKNDSSHLISGKKENEKYMRLQELYNKSRKIFPDFTVFNFHEKGNSLQNFICNVLPLATRTCHLLKKTINNQRGEQMNKSIRVDPYIISDAAYLEGLIEKSSCKKEVIELVATELQKMNEKKSIPKKCLLQNDMIRLLLLSKTMEIDWMPEWYNDQGEENHLESFLEYASNQAFCEIDTEKILADPEWIEFFENLPRKKC